MTIERVQRIDAHPIGGPVPVPRLAMMREQAASAADAAAPPIAAGQIEIRVQVTLDVRLEVGSGSGSGRDRLTQRVRGANPKRCPSTIRAPAGLLARKDPVIRDLMREHGACGLADAQHTDPFQALLHAIVSQQLSTKAAATIAARFEALYGGVPTPAQVDGHLRRAAARGWPQQAEDRLHARPVPPHRRRRRCRWRRSMRCRTRRSSPRSRRSRASAAGPRRCS